MEVIEIPTFQFETPCTIGITGSTSSGKTYFVKKLLDFRDQVFKQSPSRVIYCYGIWQDMFNGMDNVDFWEGLPTNIIEKEKGDHTLLILDDLMDLVVKSDVIQQLFTRGSHHQNITVLYINQNMYHQGRCARTINLNTQYHILFKNPRDVYQVSLFSKQLGLGRKLLDAYQDATSKPYGYLFVDLSPHNHSNLKVKTCVFPNEYVIVYV